MKFLSPVYLSGLLFIIVPIIIHLYFRKRLKKIIFSSLMFLKRTEATRLRWLRLKEILILITRCLIIAGIFLALARPQYVGTLFAKNRLAAVFIIVDNSPSMNYNMNFTTALTQAEKIISVYSPKSVFYIVPLCPQKDFKPSWNNKSAAIKILKQIKLSYSSCSLNDLLETFKTEKTALPKEFIYIGDGQMVNFRNIKETKNLFWVKIPIGNENVAIENVTIKNPFMVPKDHYELMVNIKNYSQHTYQEKIQLIAGNYIKQNECEIPPGENFVATFSLPVNIKTGTIKLDKDSLEIDNQYFFSKSLITKIDVLVVGNDDYIRLGLSPSDIAETPFHVENTTHLRKIDLRPFQTIILNGISELTDFEIIKLKNFLSEKRKGVIVFLGPGTGQHLRNFLVDCGTIENWLSVEGYLNIKWIDTDYEPFKIFADNPGIKSIKFFKLYQFTPKARVMARLSNNMPLIVNQNNLMVITTELNETNTDIIYNPNFIPLLHSLIYGLTNKYTNNEFRVGEKYPKSLPIIGPDGEILSENIFLKPGFYVVENETIGVNIDPLESNPSMLNPEIAKELGIKIITPESLQGFADLTNIFLILSLCALLCELLLMLL
ncbi:MAG: BatA domain-containing protein [bacterium]